MSNIHTQLFNYFSKKYGIHLRPSNINEVINICSPPFESGTKNLLIQTQKDFIEAPSETIKNIIWRRIRALEKRIEDLKDQL